LYLGITVEETDNWPKVICSKCSETVAICLNFMTTVRNSEITLRNLYGDPMEVAEVAIGIKPDIEMIEVKDMPSDNESVDCNFEQNFSESSCNALAESPKPMPRKRGRPRKKPVESSIEEIQDTDMSKTIPNKTRGQSKKRDFSETQDGPPTPPDAKEAPQDENSKKTRRKLIDLKEEDERIRKFFKLQCDICSESFETFKKFKAHTLHIHNEEAYVICCDRKLKNRTRLVNHLNSHINPNVFKCTKCDSKGFLTANGLNLHILNTHAPPELHKYKCTKCPRTFMTASRLKSHQISHLDDKEKKFKCPKCDKAFALNSIMQQHVRNSHDGYNKHVCEICAKVFKAKYTYQIHMNNHLDGGAGKFCCPTCGKLFKRKRLLQLHVERHNESGEIFKCNMCGKEAPNRFALKRHIQYSHLKVRKYECNLCSSAFKTPLGLKEHMATHSSSQVLYTCLFCPKQFNSNANKYVHQKRKHPVEYEAMKQKKNS
uniref:C2H2-type domain-containing protein n=1 Tax=Phlebotomus papatasi TaxID=29031 RepID=A0A1B0GNT5_PHLPP